MKDETTTGILINFDISGMNVHEIIGVKLEENQGLWNMASALEEDGHLVEIIPFNSDGDTSAEVNQIWYSFQPMARKINVF